MRIASLALGVAATACGSAQVKGRVVDDLPSVEAAPPPRVLVTADKTCHNPNGRGCDIVALLDLHTAAASEDKGFDELRAKAEAAGGDAVVGAEFEHSDKGEPSHLSGVVVRYRQEMAPPHVDVGMIDIRSDPGNEDKGLAELAKRARVMGGDRVIGVTFEHGENGAQGHLRGRVVRYTR
jgi:uncharacterized protein YbjQ (UPF0145 family)